MPRKQIDMQVMGAAIKTTTLFDAASDGILIHTLTGEIIEVNAAYCQMSGYARGELLHMPVSMLEASETPAQFTSYIEKVRKKHGYGRFETKHRRKDGTTFNVEITAQYSHDDGDQIAIFIRDISAGKQIKDRLAYLASFPEKNPTPITEVNMDGQVLYANSAALQLFPDLMARGSSHAWLAGWASVVRPFADGQTTTITRDVAVGERYYEQALTYLAPMKLVRIYGFDITERKRIDRALHQVLNELELRVQQRTQELDDANKLLSAEITDHQKSHMELETSLQELQVIEEELRNNNEMLIDTHKVLDAERLRYQDLFDNAPDGYLVTDANGKILEANQFAAQLLAISRQNLIRKPLLVFIAPEFHSTFNHVLLTLKRQAVVRSLEIKLIPRGGNPVTTAVTVASIPGEKINTLRWTIRDITERKQAEEIIRQNSLRNAVLSEVSQSLAVAGLDEAVILNIVAETTARLVGDCCVISMASEDGRWLDPVAWYHPKPEALEMMNVLYSAAHHPASNGPSGQAYQTSQPVLIQKAATPEEQKVFSPGYQKYIKNVGVESLLIVPLQLEGKTIGTIGLSRDSGGLPYTREEQTLLEILANRAAQSIHNARMYKVLQNALQKELETHEQLLQAEKFATVGRLLATITHEINNPLQTIINCLYLVQTDTASGTPVYNALTMAVKETKRLSDLVAQLREVYRPPTQGKRQLVDLTALLGEVKVLLAGYLLDKHITWEVTPPEENLLGNLTVMGVPDQLKQVFLNLGLNAIDAMETDGGRITIGYALSKDGSKIGICICDTGPGLTAEVKAKLFEPYTTTKEKGLGLGLVICLDIIQKHQGHIEVKSEPGEGAAFTVWLPVRRDEGEKAKG